MRRTASFLLVWLVSWVASVASAWAAGPDNLLRGYSLTSWSDGEGRPLGSVYAMVQDSDSYLWVGTDAGLLRFDGSRFTPWDIIGDAPLPNSAVTALCVGRDGTIWVGLADGAGVGRIRQGRLELVDPGPTTPGAISDLVEDREGTIWAVGDRTLLKLGKNGWERVKLPWKTREGQVLQVYVGDTSDLWVSTRRGLFRRHGDSDTFELLLDDYVWGVSQDAAGSVWTTDSVTGFRHLDARRRSRHALEGAGFRLMHDRKGNLWVATFGEGLWRVRGADQNGPRTDVERAALRTGLSSDSVLSLLEDRDGTIWVGTTGGLHRLAERALTPVENVGYVVAVAPADRSRMWAGTTNGVVQFSAVGSEWERTRTSSPGPDVRSMHRDGDGTLWVGATDGLWEMTNGRLQHVPASRQPLMPIASIAPHPKSGLWLGDGNWLFHWNGAGVDPLVLPDDPDLKRVTFANTDRQGRLWVGFEGGTLGLIDISGAFRRFGPAEHMEDGTHRVIHSVFEDSSGVVWVGGRGGLSRFEQGRFVTLTRANGLPGNRVWSIVEDQQGYLWLSVDRGLIRLHRDEAAKVVAAPTYRVPYRLYDTGDGVAGAAIGILGSARAGDGSLWIVRGGGVTLVNPTTLPDRLSLTPTPVRIEAVVANGRQLMPALGASLPAGTRQLQINYTALTLATANRTRFRYRLEGFDTNWVEAGSRRTAFYTNLSPRSYRFVIEARTEDRPLNPTTAVWNFTIEPAFYQTRWFQALCLIVPLVALWIAWRLRLQFVRRQFSLALAERARLSREIHDTLLQSLVGVALQVDALAINVDPSASTIRTQITRIRHQVETYIREARQAIWDLRSPLFETHGLAGALRQFGQRSVEHTPVQFAATVKGQPASISVKMEHQLLRIGQEAITNAIRHAHASRIHLALQFDPDAVTLQVTDDGQGFQLADGPVEDSSGHFGLRTMRERAGELGGELRVTTAIGSGTTVRAVVPILVPRRLDISEAS